MEKTFIFTITFESAPDFDHVDLRDELEAEALKKSFTQFNEYGMEHGELNIMLNNGDKYYGRFEVLVS